MFTTTDSTGTRVAEGDIVRYHGSQTPRCPVTLLKVSRVFPNGRMNLIHEGGHTIRIVDVRPQSVTRDC
jgi:hypothetical protein